MRKKKPTDYGYNSNAGMQGKGSTPSMAGGTSQYPEVVSYINEAVSAGISRNEIKTKLLEAGWPSDVIEKCFAEAGM